MSALNVQGIQNKIAKGWQPNNYLTNMSIAWFQADNMFIAPDVFPICTVPLSTSHYYEFSKADLARDNVKRKPAFGKVAPALFGQSDKTYSCKPDQVIVGIDDINTQDYSRARTPGMADPRRARVRFVTEQLKLHMDIMFASGFLQDGVWSNTFQGVASGPTGNQMLKFNDGNFDPVNFFNARKREILQRGRRNPNVLTLGIDSFNALCEHPDIIERVKYSGSTPNPAVVNENVLAQLLGFERVKVCMGTYNAGGFGQENMQFVCPANCALITYTNPAPAIDEPTAGYIFAWDMLGDGNYTALDQWEGEKGTHTEFVEGLMCYDMHKVSDDLATYMKGCV